MEFVAGWYGEPQQLPWWERVIKIRGVRLHVAGLDSAWMSCGDEDPSRLLVGRYQLTQTVETAQVEAADWRIVVVHHPWGYLAEFDQHTARSAVHQHGDLLLRGHLHQPLSERVVPPDPRRACLELAAGCVYDGSQYPNAFQWIELSPATKNVRVLFRAGCTMTGPSTATSRIAPTVKRTSSSAHSHPRSRFLADRRSVSAAD
jgi:hypothetical protein